MRLLGRLARVMPGFVLLCVLAHAGQAQTQKIPAKQVLRVAAAADLMPVMPTLAAEYERETGVKLEVSYGSSSALATQILHGAPMDIFFGADFTFPMKVIAANLADEKLPVPYAQGTLVLWARRDLPMPVTIELLSDPRIHTIAVADEIRAPYGRAAYDFLRHIKLLDGVKPKLVVAENVSQAAQFVESGNAQLGFISQTLAGSDKLKIEGKFVQVPKVYTEIRQCAVVMKNAKQREEAHDFLEWMRSSKVQESLPKFGMEPVR